MRKRKYKRDWSNYDKNVITRYKLMFPPPSTFSNTG